MISFAIAPMFFVCFIWHRRQMSLKSVDSNLELLVRLKQLCRSSVAIPNQCEPGVAKVISEALDMGLSCSASLSQSAVWLRLFKVQSLKAHRLICMWSIRVIVVMAISLALRCYLLDSSFAAVFGISSADRYLMLLSGLTVFTGTIMFFKLVPRVGLLGPHEVAGLSDWLRDRIFVESGIHLTASSAKILNFEASELRTGVGLVPEKIEALDEVWRARIDTVEKKIETASEVMPFLELVFFGLFILCLLLEPSLQFAG